MTLSPALKHVLIIDDDPTLREVLKSFYEDHGVEKISTAEDGKKGLEILEVYGDTIDLISTDLNMPDIDGIEFMQRIQSLQFKIPIIIVSSAHSTIIRSAEVLAKNYNVQLLGILEKPIKPHALETILAPYLDS
ncbi:MAG: response regulator [Hyphomicrobiaceae bacterium]